MIGRRQKPPRPGMGEASALDLRVSSHKRSSAATRKPSVSGRPPRGSGGKFESTLHAPEARSRQVTLRGYSPPRHGDPRGATRTECRRGDAEGSSQVQTGQSRFCALLSAIPLASPILGEVPGLVSLLLPLLFAGRLHTFRGGRAQIGKLAMPSRVGSLRKVV